MKDELMILTIKPTGVGDPKVPVRMCLYEGIRVDKEYNRVFIGAGDDYEVVVMPFKEAMEIYEKERKEESKKSSSSRYNIGKVRRFLFMPFSCRWNAWVRDVTADVELKLRRYHERKNSKNVS